MESYTDPSIPLTKTHWHSTSIHLIPSPDSPGKPFKPYKSLMMNFVMVIAVPAFMIILGLGLEIALSISNVTDGFKLSQNNIFIAMKDVIPQCLSSLFPTLLVIPAAIAWRELDWILRRYQPYIVLQQSKGHAKAEESLLLDYVDLGPLWVLLRAFDYKHRVILLSSLTAIFTYTYQPLASTIFQIQQRPKQIDIHVTSTQSIDLSQQMSDLDIFVSAAGYVGLSVLFDFPDPPFVHNAWSTAKFEFPENNYINGSLTIPNTTGIQTNVNCSNPSEQPIITPVDTTNFNLGSTSVDGCVVSASVNSTVPYGVSDVACPGNASTLQSSLRPVMFWFFQIRADNNQPEARTVFCTPIVQIFEIRVLANLNNGSLTTVSPIGNSPPPNLTAFNGLISDNITDPFIEGRAFATRLVLLGAIFRSAQQSPNGLQSTFDSPNGFLDLTSTLYTRHLALSAQSLYFSNSNTTLSALVSSLFPTLKIVATPTHMLSAMLILTGLMGVFFQVSSWRTRQKLLLAAPIGTLASTIALTSRSGFGERLNPHDDEFTMKNKLNDLRFGLDERTGAIVAEARN